MYRRNVGPASRRTPRGAAPRRRGQRRAGGSPRSRVRAARGSPGGERERPLRLADLACPKVWRAWSRLYLSRLFCDSVFVSIRVEAFFELCNPCSTAESDYIIDHTKRRGRGSRESWRPPDLVLETALSASGDAKRGGDPPAPRLEAVRRTRAFPVLSSPVRVPKYQRVPRSKQLLPASFRNVVFHRCIAIGFCARKCLLFFYPDLGA